jgi:ABC-2 type transport system permease protein
VSSASRLVEFPSPQTVIGRFVTRRTIRSAAFVALIFGAYVAAKSIGYESAFPSVQSRIAVTASFTKNVGLTALLGAPHHLETVAGFAAWNTFIVMVMIGAIWAYLTTTRLFRGEEDQGRWELMLSGLTTARRATANVLIGFGTSLIVLFLVTAVSFIAIGRLDTVRIGTGPSLFFALATVTAAFMFAAVGALASQLMPTRARAATISTAVFGIFFLVRAAGDITSAHWLVKVSPLGWIELLEPLTGSQPLWLIPIILFTAILVALTIYLAGRRDLGASIFADHDTAKPRLLLLRGPLTAAIRLTRTSSLSWLLGLAALAAFFGLLTKTAADAITSSLNTEKIITNLTQNSQQIGAQTFLGVVFFFLMTVTMCYAASAVSAMREDEAQGYLESAPLDVCVGYWDA